MELPNIAAYAYQDVHVWSALLTCLRPPAPPTPLPPLPLPPLGPSVGDRAGVGCCAAAVPPVRHDTGCGSCSTWAAARVRLSQHPRGPSIGNGAGLAAVRMQC